ncbi:unnamed protein product, partial [Sphagnum compactum]
MKLSIIQFCRSRLLFLRNTSLENCGCLAAISFRDHTHLVGCSRLDATSVIGRLGLAGLSSQFGLLVRDFHHGGSKWSSEFRIGERESAPRLLVVQPRVYPRTILKAKLLEALRLADSLEGLRGRSKAESRKHTSPFVLVQSPQSRSSSKRLRAGVYFGAGTIDIVRAHVDAAASREQLDAVFVNAPLSGVQQRNLEAAWGKPVLDRVGLIIEIFGAHAQTKEAKLQVELAALDYKKTRLVRVLGKGGARLGFGVGGEDEVVSARGRASGAIGGAGETELQLQRRRIGERRDRLKQMLKEVQRTRSLHRAARQRHAFAGSCGRQLPVVAVVGYTNAGKSSMVAALSKSSVYVDDRLFATLDPRVRSVVLPSGRKVLLSDTVGFISDLPVQLVEAFQATLEEVVEADFLLHVIDSSAANVDEQREAVLDVLKGIGVPKAKLESCMVEAWNKVDLIEGVSTFEDHSSLLLAKDTDPSPTEQEESSNSNLFSKDDEVMSNGVTAGLGKRDERVILGLGWSQGGMSRVSTSASKGIGLGALLHLLDKKLGEEL